MRVCVGLCVFRERNSWEESTFTLISDSDVIRQSFVRGGKWKGKKKRQRKPEGDELHHEYSAKP